MNKKRISGPPPINKTIRKYFRSLNWRELWDKIKNDNPIVFIVVKRHTGLIESVMVKEAKKGEEFIVDPEEFIKKEILENAPIPMLSDEQVMKEIGAIMDGVKTEELPNPELTPKIEDIKKREFIPVHHPDGETTDLEIGDSIFVSHNLEKKKCYVVSIDEDQKEITVEFQDGSMVTKKEEDIISLAK